MNSVGPAASACVCDAVAPLCLTPSVILKMRWSAAAFDVKSLTWRIKRSSIGKNRLSSKLNAKWPTLRFVPLKVIIVFLPSKIKSKLSAGVHNWSFWVVQKKKWTVVDKKSMSIFTQIIRQTFALKAIKPLNFDA